MAYQLYKLPTTHAGRMLLTLLSIALCILSLPGNPLPALAAVCFVPLGLAMHGASRWQAMLYGFMFGFIGWLDSTAGLAASLSSYVQLNIAETFVYMFSLCVFLAIPYGVFGLLYGVFQWMESPLGVFKTAACLTILVSIIPSPIPVSPAHSLYLFPLFTQILDIGGETLLLFVLAVVNWLFVDLLLRLQSHQSLKGNLAIMIVLLTVITTYGYFRLSQYRHEEATSGQARMITVASIQPNIPLPTSTNGISDKDADPLATLLRMSERALRDDPQIELVVWPEIPRTIHCERKSTANIQLFKFAKRYRTYVLINCEQASGDGGKYNTALMIAPDGNISSYHKQRLFPFVEYLPNEKIFPLLRKIIPGASRYLPGKETVVFRVKESWFVFTAICYEVLFTDHVWRFIEKGGNVLVNPANDAWFANSRIPDFLISAGVYQAIKYNIPLVRISNSGNSLFVKANGEMLSSTRTDNFTQGATIFRIFAPGNRTLYAYLGNSFLYLLILLWAVSLFDNKPLIVRKQVDLGA
jgi:apolipoprotein N-acyltransferase